MTTRLLLVLVISLAAVSGKTTEAVACKDVKDPDKELTLVNDCIVAYGCNTIKTKGSKSDQTPKSPSLFERLLLRTSRRALGIQDNTPLGKDPDAGDDDEDDDTPTCGNYQYEVSGTCYNVYACMPKESCGITTFLPYSEGGLQKITTTECPATPPSK